MKRPWIETFVALSQADGRGAARLFYMYALTVGTVDYNGFQEDVREHFKTFAGKTLGQVEASVVLGGMMHILRKHRVQVDPVFTVVNIALLVAEGLGKQLDDRLDFIEMAKPYIRSTLRHLSARAFHPGDSLPWPLEDSVRFKLLVHPLGVGML